MGKKLYVGNLPYTISDSELEQVFAAHGAVASAQVIMDRESGRSKGSRLMDVTFSPRSQQAINLWNEARQLSILSLRFLLRCSRSVHFYSFHQCANSQKRLRQKYGFARRPLRMLHTHGLIDTSTQRIRSSTISSLQKNSF